MILPAQTIRRLGILSPFCERTRFNGVTHGLSAAGYDLRLSDRIELFPGACRLVDAVERFDMPLDVIAMLYTKSTWARSHIRVANTVIDPGWRGVLRLEISQHFGEPVVIEAGTGIAYVIFERLEEATEQPYEGKYQDQRSDQNANFETDSSAPCL